MERNEIDKLFKKRLEHPDVHFEEAHWDAMAKKLDQTSPKSRRNLVAILSLGAAAAAVLLFFVVRMFDPSEPAPTTKDANSILAEAPAGRIEGKKVEIAQPVDKNVKQRQRIFVNKEGYIAAIRTTAIKPDFILSEQETEPVFVRELDSLEEVHPRFRRSSNIPEQLTFQTTTREQIKISPILDEEPLSIGNGKKSLGTLSILVAPDLTSVRGAGQSSFSQNIGLTYTYPVTNRISISTGALYARKNYNSPYSFYKPVIKSSSGYYSDHSPDQVSAYCDVLDIPITVGVNVYKSRKNSLNVHLGASSYFMLRENYTFFYEGEVDREYEVKGKNSHVMGVADFSVSFEHKLSDKINIGIRPFYKMPLTGIGYGQTKLDSKGVAVTLGLDFFKKR